MSVNGCSKAAIGARQGVKADWFSRRHIWQMADVSQPRQPVKQNGSTEEAKDTEGGVERNERKVARRHIRELYAPDTPSDSLVSWHSKK